MGLSGWVLRIIFNVCLPLLQPSWVDMAKAVGTIAEMTDSSASLALGGKKSAKCGFSHLENLQNVPPPPLPWESGADVENVLIPSMRCTGVTYCACSSSGGGMVRKSLIPLYGDLQCGDSWVSIYER